MLSRRHSVSPASRMLRTTSGRARPDIVARIVTSVPSSTTSDEDVAVRFVYGVGARTTRVTAVRHSGTNTATAATTATQTTATTAVMRTGRTGSAAWNGSGFTFS